MLELISGFQCSSSSWWPGKFSSHCKLRNVILLD